MNSVVSIVIVTYNSSRFVIETLESVLKQTWKRLELIITDDCSQDNTVEVCKNWLNANKNAFVFTSIITSEKNTGVPANANRGLKASKGDWLIFLAGDDTLKFDCIENNMSWIASHPEVKVLFSQVEVYKNNIEPQDLITTIPKDPYNPKGIMAPGRSAASQYKMLLRSDKIHYTPSAFLNRQTLMDVGGFDERFKLLEDHPLWLNLTKKGYKLNYLDKVTVNYRRHVDAIHNTGMSYLINPTYFKLERFRKIYTYPYLPADIRLYRQYYWYASQVFRCNWLNRNKMPNRILLDLLTSYLNPFRYYIFIKMLLNKNLKEDEFYN
jgi:glycosyltransferase involved in cell wall biosynthesis